MCSFSLIQMWMMWLGEGFVMHVPSKCKVMRDFIVFV